MKKEPSSPSSAAEPVQIVKTVKNSIPTQEQENLKAVVATARENVQQTVKRLMESESVSNDLLSMRLERSHVHGGDR